LNKNMIHDDLASSDRGHSQQPATSHSASPVRPPRPARCFQRLGHLLLPPDAPGSKAQEHLDRHASLLKPQFQLSVFVFFYAHFFDLSMQGSPPFATALPFAYNASSSAALQVGEANANALVLMSVVVFMTLLFVLVFRFRLARFLLSAVVLSYAWCWGGFAGYFMYRACGKTHCTLDLPTLVLLAVNLGAACALLVFGAPAINAPQKVSDFLLVLLAGVAAWPLACLSELTVLFFLIWMALWDLFAVLTPCGPLKYIMDLQQERLWMAEESLAMPKGMVYETRLYTLGLGDLVFFGLVIARCAVVDWPTCVAGMECMLASAVFTVAITTQLQRTIPALPLPLALGFLTYLASRFSLLGFTMYMSKSMIVV
jgi:presenilin 1